MTTVLAALDANPSARPVLGTAIAIAPLFDATAAALHVRENGAGIAGETASLANVPLRLGSGPPVDQIVLAAEAPGVAALVIGARGRHGGPRPAGHTALEVITRVPKPVVVVPPEAQPRARLNRILVPLEGTHTSSRALEDVVKLAHRSELEVLVLHVHTPESMPAFANHEPHASQAWDREFLARHVPTPHERITLVRQVGFPADNIVAVARQRNVDLVALAWSQHLSPGRASVVSETLAGSNVPVLLLPVPVVAHRPAATRSRAMAPRSR
jgi:nucleotide-binding universal stress UspA family protein